MRRAALFAPAGLALGALLAACGGPAAPAAPGAATTSASTSASGTATGSASPGTTTATSPPVTTSDSTRTITVEVRGRTVTPKPGTVEVEAGEPVRLVITSDRANEVHLHGVEIEKALPAGEAVTITFTPREQGVFEVETHDPQLVLLKLAVR